MLKSVLYYLLFLTTTVRLADIIYLLTQKSTNLSAVVFAVTSAVVLYGIVLTVKRFTGSLRLKQLMFFFMAQTVAFAFNLVYVASTSPLSVSIMEALAVGTFLDILIGCCAVHFCVKQMRGGMVTVGIAQ